MTHERNVAGSDPILNEIDAALRQIQTVNGPRLVVADAQLRDILTAPVAPAETHALYRLPPTVKQSKSVYVDEQAGPAQAPGAVVEPARSHELMPLAPHAVVLQRSVNTAGSTAAPQNGTTPDRAPFQENVSSDQAPSHRQPGPIVEARVERADRESADSPASPSLFQGFSQNHGALWIVAGLLAAVATLFAIARWPIRAIAKGAPAAQVGSLTVMTKPAGLAVSIDGVDRGTTPATIAVSAGAHTIVLRFASETKSVGLTVKAGEQVSQYFEFADPLPPEASASGRLSLSIDRGSARVQVDGRPRGNTPLELDGLPIGDHLVTLVTDAGRMERRVKIQPGVITSVVFGASQASAGWIVVSAPFEVQIYQDKDLVGSSAGPKIMVPAGRHIIRLSNVALGFEETRQMDVAAGKTNALRVAAPMARVNINAKPWANVLVDGAPHGPTPLGDVSLAIGTHQITFQHPQLGERQVTTVVTVAGPNRASADFTKQ